MESADAVKPNQSGPSCSVELLLSVASGYVGFTVLEALDQRPRKVGCASYASKPNTGTKRAKHELNAVKRLPCLRTSKTLCTLPE